MSKVIQYLLALFVVAPILLCWFLIVHVILAALQTINGVLEILLLIQRGKP